jgi:hypothetical protein
VQQLLQQDSKLCCRCRMVYDAAACGLDEAADLLLQTLPRRVGSCCYSCCKQQQC